MYYLTERMVANYFMKLLEGVFFQKAWGYNDDSDTSKLTIVHNIHTSQIICWKNVLLMEFEKVRKKDK